jgi:light-regulated signal transduction histidine kinase (bacteriophytochrome)
MPDQGLHRIIDRLADSFTRDILVQTTVNHLRNTLQVARVVLYYFYEQWKGRVTFESLGLIQIFVGAR